MFQPTRPWLSQFSDCSWRATRYGGKKVVETVDTRPIWWVSRVSAASSTVGSRLVKPEPLSNASATTQLTSGRNTKSRCAASERRAMSMAKSLPNRVSTRLSARRQPSPLSQVGASDMPMCRPLLNVIRVSGCWLSMV
ncbi:hypothetical protein D3C76_1250420 [compost metagenome]